MCKPCAPGTVATERGAEMCRECPAGTFEDAIQLEYGFDAKTGCIMCAPGTFTDVAGLRSCKICRPGTLSAMGATSCMPCPAGKFASRIAAVGCQDCPAGTISLGLRPAACKPPVNGCTFDTFEKNNRECEKCVPGEKYNPRSNWCEPCGNKQVSFGGVSTECHTCPDGEVPARGISLRDGLKCVCKLGTERTNSGCSPCTEGFFSTFIFSGESNKNGKETLSRSFGDAIEPSCRRCPRGTSSKAGSTKCERCTAGFYLAEDLCLRCPAGFKSRITSLVSNETLKCFSENTSCPVGLTKRELSCSLEDCGPDECLFQGECKTCPPGNYMVLINARCFPCPPKQTSHGGTVTSCSRCPRGKVGFRGRCVCPGEFEERNGECVKCPSGTFSRIGEGCINCSPGTFGAIRFGYLGCEWCPIDPVTTVESGATGCVRCPPGSKEGENLLRLENNKCVPVDPYNKDPAFLASLPGFESA